MPETDPQVPETVSVEAHKRVQHDNEQLKARITDLETSIVDMGKLRRTESFLRNKGVPESELSARVDLLAPHLNKIEVDKIEELLASDKFGPLVAVPTSPPSVDPGANPPLVPEGGFGNQPNPGGNDPVVQTGKVGPGDAEYEAARGAAVAGDHSKMEALYAGDRVKEPTRPW